MVLKSRVKELPSETSNYFCCRCVVLVLPYRTLVPPPASAYFQYWIDCILASSLLTLVALPH